MTNLTSRPGRTRAITRRGWARTAVVGTAVALMSLGVGAVASADPSTALIDPAQKGSITIHKLVSPSAGPANQGQPVSNPPGSPAEGVEFTVTPIIGVDLTTNAGWGYADLLVSLFDPSDLTSLVVLDLDPITPGNQGIALNPAQAKVDSTDSNGEVTFANLDIGLYLVEETGGFPAGTAPLLPFLVTIPITSTDTAGASLWDYTVDVYPKNITLPTISKTLQGTPVLGNQVTYEITSTINNGTHPDYYRILDGIPASLTYDPANGPATVTLVDPTGVGTTVSLTDGSEYDATILDPLAPENVLALPIAVGGAVVPGATWLALDFETTLINDPQYQGWTIVIDVPVTIASMTILPVSNEAWLFPSQDAWDLGPVGGAIPTADDPTFRLGSITIETLDATSLAPLPGTQYQVYPALPDGTPDLSSPLTIGGENTWTADDLGQITLEGLALSDWDPNAASLIPGQSGALITDSQKVTPYYLVETNPPAGYSLLADPVPFLVTEATTLSLAPVPDLTVKNAKFNGGFALPLTGGQGSLLLISLAVLLAAGGVTVLAVRRRHPQPTRAAKSL